MGVVGGAAPTICELAVCEDVGGCWLREEERGLAGRVVEEEEVEGVRERLVDRALEKICCRRGLASEV